MVQDRAHSQIGRTALGSACTAEDVQCIMCFVELIFMEMAVASISSMMAEKLEGGAGAPESTYICGGQLHRAASEGSRGASSPTTLAI